MVRRWLQKKGTQFITAPSGTTHEVSGAKFNVPKFESVRKSCNVVIEVLDNDGNKRQLRGLLDAGCTKSIALKHCVKKDELKVLPKGQGTKYKIYNQVFESRGAGTVEFKLKDFSNTKKISWDFQVDMSSNKDDMPYDVVIGTDLNGTTWNDN